MPVRTTDELQYILDEKQKGRDIDPNNPESLQVAKNATQQDWEALANSIMARRSMNADQRRALRQAENEGYADYYNALSDMAAQSDYGSYKGDLSVPFEEWVQNPVDYRANSQSDAEKILNGILKGVITAGTTYVDNTAGLISGILQTGTDALDEKNGFHPGKDFIYGNIVGNAMQSVRDWSEKVLPNYRTQEEINDEDQWWKHLNANFWGDSFLKNLGFTVGAGLSGATMARGFRAMQGKLVNKAYKAAAAASIDGNEAAEKAFQEVMRGELVKNPEGFSQAYNKLSRTYGKLSAQSMLVGSVGGAIGESRTEALGAAKEFRDSQIELENERRAKGMAALEAEMQTHPEFYTDAPVFDEVGNVVDLQPVLNDAGKAYYDKKVAALNEVYQSRMNAIDTEANNLAKRVFGLNMPLLTASNVVMFGRMFSGGYRSQTSKLVNGGLDIGYATSRTAATGVKEGIKNTLSEGLEELNQKFISESMKDVASANMSAFNDGKYDKNAIRSVSDWLNSIDTSVRRVAGSGSSWEEFAIGALTGALGMPSKSGWSGGIYGSIQENNELRKKGEEYAKLMNERLADSHFRDNFLSAVRHQKLDDVKALAAENKDKFAWHTADEQQLISDILLWRKAGALNDLNEMADSLSSLSPEEAHEIRPLFQDDTDPDFNNKSDEYVANWIKKRAKQVKETIRQVSDFYDALKLLSGNTTSDAAIEEMVYTAAQMQKFENRYADILNGVISRLRPTIENVSREVDTIGQPTKRAERAQKLLESESDLRQLFGGLALSLEGRAEDEKGSSTLDTVFRLLDDERQAEVLKELEDWGSFAADPSLKEDVQDLQKLIRSRQQFYGKLLDPSFRDKFEAEAKTDESEAAELQGTENQKKVDGYLTQMRNAKTLSDFVRLNYDIQQNEQDADVLKLLDQSILADSQLKSLQDKGQAVSDFIQSVADRISSKVEEAGKKGDNASLAALTSLDGTLNNINDTLPDILASYDGTSDPRIRVANELLSSATPGSMEDKLLRGMMDELLGDIAKANSLGTMPVVTIPSADYTRLSDLISKMTDSNDKLLNDIINNDFTGYPGLTDDEKTKLNAEATAKKNELDGIKTGPSEDYKKLADLIGKVSASDNNLLNDIINGDFSAYPGLAEDEKLQLISLAVAKKAELERREGEMTGGHEKDPVPDPGMVDDKTRKERSKAFNERNRRGINGTPTTLYDNNEARKGNKRRYTSASGNARTAERTNQKLDWNERHHVQRFVDSGVLAALNNLYRRKGKRLPIFFIGNPHVSDLASNPFADTLAGYPQYLNRTTDLLFALDISDIRKDKDASDLLKKYENAGVFSNDTLIEIGGKKYQVIGEATNPNLDRMAAADKKAYLGVKAEYNKMWNHAVRDSILPQFKAETETVGEGTLPAEGKWYVAKTVDGAKTDNGDDRLYTTLHHIESGRDQHTLITDSGVRIEISLGDALKEYKAEGKEVTFHIVTAKGTSSEEQILRTEIGAPLGSLWIGTTRSDGSKSFSHVTVRQTNEVDWDTFRNTVIGKEIVSNLNKIFGVNKGPHGSGTTFKDKTDAIRKLHERLYLGKGNTFTIDTEDNGSPSLWIGMKKCLSTEDAINALKTGQYKFQVSKEDVKNSSIMDSLTSSGVLATDMASFERFNSSFVVNFLVDQNEKGEDITPHPVEMSASVAADYGQNTGLVTEDNPLIGSKAIRLGPMSYTMDSTGAIRYYNGNRKGEVVTDPVVKAQIMAISEVLSFKNQLQAALINSDTDEKFLSAEENVFAGYEGRRWNIHTVTTKGRPVEHTNLFERTIGGITVHLVQNGKNGTVRIVYSNDEWNRLRSVADSWGKAYLGRSETNPGGQQTETKKDNQGNPIDDKGNLIKEKVSSIDEITDEDFTNPKRTIELPTIAEGLSSALGIANKPVIIKKNIFEKNKKHHPELSPSDSRSVLSRALYSPTHYGSIKPISRPDYKVAVQTGDKNAVVVLDIYEGKEEVQIVGWRNIDANGLANMKRQAQKEGGQLLILSPTQEGGLAADLSALQSSLSENKGTESPSNPQGNNPQETSNDSSDNLDSDGKVSGDSLQDGDKDDSEDQDDFDCGF